jgi:hypothetical protein
MGKENKKKYHIGGMVCIQHKIYIIRKDSMYDGKRFSLYRFTIRKTIANFSSGNICYLNTQYKRHSIVPSVSIKIYLAHADT